MLKEKQQLAVDERLTVQNFVNVSISYHDASVYCTRITATSMS